MKNKILIISGIAIILIIFFVVLRNKNIKVEEKIVENKAIENADFVLSDGDRIVVTYNEEDMLYEYYSNDFGKTIYKTPLETDYEVFKENPDSLITYKNDIFEIEQQYTGEEVEEP